MITSAQAMKSAITAPLLYKSLIIPRPFQTSAWIDNTSVTYGGDLRIGDLSGNGKADFLVYRSQGDAHDDGGTKPCFLGAFSMDGEILWSVGTGGTQPSRPGPVAIHDIDGDGCAEVICFFVDATIKAAPTSLADIVIQIRDGKTGALKRQASPAALRTCTGEGPNWVHQRLLIANLRGLATPRDIVVKLGATLLAFDEKLNVLWRYTIHWNDYGRCSAYIPAVGDINGDGFDEINGGYYLLDHSGMPLWEKPLAPHMDSVAITTWDNGNPRAICSGGGHVMDEQGRTLLSLGEECVPHGQEARVARFRADDPDPQMIIRHRGHTPDVIVVDTQGTIINAFQLNSSPNHTGMTVVYWHGPTVPAVLYNGGMLWDPISATGVPLPDLPTPQGPARMGWYHAIPANICGDDREEIVVYNPWDRAIMIYTPVPLNEAAYGGYVPGPRQYNARLMD